MAIYKTAKSAQKLVANDSLDLVLHTNIEILESQIIASIRFCMK